MNPESYVKAYVPKIYHKRMQKVLDEEITPQQAIDLHCYMCQGWDDGVKEAVRDCECRWCPLWPLRPGYRKKKKVKLSEEELERRRSQAEHARSYKTV